MPVYRDETYEQSTFRLAYPDVAAWAEAGMMQTSTLRRIWTSRRVFSPAALAGVNREMSEQMVSNLSEPAERWDCMYIPNGVYNVFLAGEEFRVSIHLVQSGNLSGKKVVRYWFPGDNSFTNIGWLTKEGTLSLWRRMQRYEGSDFVLAIRKLLVALRDFGRDMVIASSVSETAMRIAREDISITPFVRCFHCSGVIESNPGLIARQHCAAHDAVENPRITLRNIVSVDDRFENNTPDDFVIGRRTISSIRSRRAVPAPPSQWLDEEREVPVAASEPSERTRRTPLPVDEVLGGSVVQ